MTRAEPVHLRHDLVVILGALLLMLVGWTATRSLGRPELAEFSRRGLTVAYPAGWFPSDPGAGEMPATITFRSNSSAAEWLEIELAPKPLIDGALVSVLDLERTQRFGEFYKKLESGPKEMGGIEWLRTHYAHAYIAAEGDAPQILHGIDYALVRGHTLYVVQVHASEDRVGDLEEELLTSVSIGR